MTIGNIVNVRELPLIGDWVGKIGKIQDIMALPCGPSVDIWVSAAWVAAPKLIWTFVAPDCLDSAVARGVPPLGKDGGAQRRAHGRRRLGRIRQGRVADPTTWAGKASNEIPLPKGAVSTALFKIFGISQQAAFYFIIADATAEFLIDWTSLAMQAQGCETGESKAAKAEITPGDLHGDTGDWHPDFWTATWTNANVQFTNHIRISGLTTCLIGIAYEFKVADFEPDGAEATVECRLWDDLFGGVIDSASPVVIRKGSIGSASYLTAVTNPFDTEIDVIPEVRVSDATIEYLSCTANVMLAPGPLDFLKNSPCVPTPIEWPTQYLPQIPILNP